MTNAHQGAENPYKAPNARAISETEAQPPPQTNGLFGLRLNRWVYISFTIIGYGALVGAGVILDNEYCRAASLLFIAVMTFPAGLGGWLVSFPLLFMGIATPDEAAFVSAPLYVLAGYLQWYVVLPYAYGQRKP